MLSSVVSVNITRQTKVPSQKGFGVPAFLTPEAVGLLAERVQVFSSETILAELVALGFTTGSQTYKWAVATIAQNPKVENLMVIVQNASVVQTDTINIDTVANNTTYSVTFSGVTVEFLSDADATDVEIQAGLIGLLAAIPGVTAGFVANGTNAIDVTATNAGEGHSISVGANLSVTAGVANNGPVEEIQAARDVNDDWYFLETSVHTKLQTELISAYIETQIKLFGYQTDEAEVKDSSEAGDTGSVAKLLKDKNYDRSFGLWVPTAELGSYKMGVWVGIMAPKEAGSATWKFKTGKGISADSFSSTELSNIESKNVNVYIKIAGIDMFQEGVVASGEYIDIMRGTDWITARIQENVFGLLTSEDKVPYTDGGIETVGLQVEDVLDQAVTNKILIGDGEDEDGNSLRPTVTVPRRSETTTADRAARTLRNVKFKGFYAGAIHKVFIDGNLSV